MANRLWLGLSNGVPMIYYGIQSTDGVLMPTLYTVYRVGKKRMICIGILQETNGTQYTSVYLVIV